MAEKIYCINGFNCRALLIDSNILKALINEVIKITISPNIRLLKLFADLWADNVF